MDYFICEITKPIKRRSKRAASDPKKSMNKILSVHTNVKQCLWQMLRDGRCYHGKNPFRCEEFARQAQGVNLDALERELTSRIKDSLVLRHRAEAESKEAYSVAIDACLPALLSVVDRKKIEGRLCLAGLSEGGKLRLIAGSGPKPDCKLPKSKCIMCGTEVQYPHNPKTKKVTCWLCVANEVYEHEKGIKKPEPKEVKSNEGKNNLPGRKPIGGLRCNLRGPAN
jgi:hypothetical protein